MNGAELALDVAMLLLGGIGLFEGLLRLASSPLEGALIILGAMSLLYVSGGQFVRKQDALGPPQRHRTGFA